MTFNARVQRKRGHGEGNVEERGPGRYRLRYRVDGKVYRRAFGDVEHPATLADAKRELRRILTSADDGQHVAPDKLTLADWVDQWVALLRRGGAKAGRGLVNARTLERYEELLRLHVIPALGSRPLQRLTAIEIDELYCKLAEKLSPRTVHHVHTVLGGCLNTAVRKGLLVANPVRRAEAPVAGDSDAATSLDQDQLAVLVAGFRGLALYPIVAVAAFTGARRNEILALRWSEFDPVARTLTIARSLEKTKTHGVRFKEPKTPRGRRTIAIDDGLATLLVAEREKALRLVAGVGDGGAVDLSLVKLPADALMFPSPGDGLTRPRNERAVTHEFGRLAKKILGFHIRLHDLRGSHETLLLDAGVPVHVVAARCGHDPAILLRSYARRTKKADTAAATIIGTMSKAVLA